MKNSFFFTTLIVLISLSSCVRSLYPLTDDENKFVFKKELIGSWIDQDSTKYIVDTVARKTYRITIIEKDTSYFLANLVELNSKLFLDCSAEMERFKRIGESAAYSVLPTHFIMRLYDVKPNSIQIGSIESSPFMDLLNAKKINVKGESLDKDDFVMTAESKSVQNTFIELEKFPTVYKKQAIIRHP
jgi:hypothetical protein